MWVSQKEAWKQFCDEYGAKYLDKNMLKSKRIEKEFQNWNIVLDTYTVMANNVPITYTRIRTLFENKSGLVLRIYRRSLFTGIAKIFGMQDIQIGSPTFDEEFVVKGNDEATIVRLMENRKIREIISEQKSFDLRIKEYKKKHKGNVSEMYYQTNGIVKDVQQLKKLFDLYCEMLLMLTEINVAGVGSVDAVLK